ncbi:MAG: DUF1049 domain-containing protein [Acidimicrobiia bacterium]|nr:DUF1049 domain-containing protein [Acidimicrobiia bacterium]
MSTSRTPEQQPGAPERAGPGRGALAALSGTALLLIFMLQNTQDIPVHLLFWHATLPVWFIIFGSALVGALVWVGAGIVRRHRRRTAASRSRQGRQPAPG